MKKVYEKAEVKVYELELETSVLGNGIVTSSTDYKGQDYLEEE